MTMHARVMRVELGHVDRGAAFVSDKIVPSAGSSPGSSLRTGSQSVARAGACGDDLGERSRHARRRRDRPGSVTHGEEGWDSTAPAAPDSALGTHRLRTSAFKDSRCDLAHRPAARRSARWQ